MNSTVTFSKDLDSFEPVTRCEDPGKGNDGWVIGGRRVPQDSPSRDLYKAGESGSIDGSPFHFLTRHIHSQNPTDMPSLDSFQATIQEQLDWCVAYYFAPFIILVLKFDSS